MICELIVLAFKNRGVKSVFVQGADIKLFKAFFVHKREEAGLRNENGPIHLPNKRDLYEPHAPLLDPSAATTRSGRQINGKSIKISRFSANVQLFLSD